MSELVHLLRELVQIPSLSGNERTLAEYVAAWLRPFCDSVLVDEMYNVAAELHGNRPGKTVLFNAHLDTVPPGDMGQPFAGQILTGEKFDAQGDVIYGRGACDDKGGVAAMMAAARRLASDRDFSGTLILTFVAQEENGQAPGTEYVMGRLRQRVDFAVLGEPTGLDLYLGHRGKVEFFLDAYGVSAHASNPANGINAVNLVSEFVQKMKAAPLPCHPILGGCSWALTYITCPDPGKAAIIPAQASIRFDRRYLPEETPNQVQSQLQILLQELELNNPGAHYVLEQNYVMPPYYIEPDHSAVQLMQCAVMRVRGRAAQYKTWISGTDGTFLYNDFGIPTIGLGPGPEADIHSAREHVPIQQLEEATAIYEQIVRTSYLYDESIGG